MALDAGCDMVLICNHRESAIEAIDSLGEYSEPASQVRLARLHGRRPTDRETLLASEDWKRVREAVRHLTDPPPLELNG